jgi:hypothetical protein
MCIMEEPPSNDREDNYGITSIIEFLIFSISDALITVYKDRDDTFPLIHLQSGNSRLHSNSCKKNMKSKTASNKQYKSNSHLYHSS